VIPSVRTLLEKLGPHGGARCIPVDEYLCARAGGQLEVQRMFHAGLLLRNGVYRTTLANRMTSTLPRLLSLARELGPHPVRVLDVACSSGISTLEMHQAFVEGGVPCETCGTDLLLWVDFVRRDDGVGVLFDHGGQVLQVEIGKWASPWRWRPRDRVLRPRLVARARRVVEKDLEPFRAALHGPVAGHRAAKVSLLSSQVEGVAGLRFVEEDILQPRVTGPFSLIRAANILNLGYFDADGIRRMARALGDRLQEGGALVIVRSEGPRPINRGTVFRRREGRLVAEAHMNSGSEAAGIVG